MVEAEVRRAAEPVGGGQEGQRRAGQAGTRRIAGDLAGQVDNSERRVRAVKPSDLAISRCPSPRGRRPARAIKVCGLRGSLRACGRGAWCVVRCALQLRSRAPAASQQTPRRPPPAPPSARRHVGSRMSPVAAAARCGVEAAAVVRTRAGVACRAREPGWSCPIAASRWAGKLRRGVQTEALPSSSSCSRRAPPRPPGERAVLAAGRAEPARHCKGSATAGARALAGEFCALPRTRRVWAHIPRWQPSPAAASIAARPHRVPRQVSIVAARQIAGITGRPGGQPSRRSSSSSAAAAAQRSAQLWRAGGALAVARVLGAGRGWLAGGGLASTCAPGSLPQHTALLEPALCLRPQRPPQHHVVALALHHPGTAPSRNPRPRALPDARPAPPGAGRVTGCPRTPEPLRRPPIGT